MENGQFSSKIKDFLVFVFFLQSPLIPNGVNEKRFNFIFEVSPLLLFFFSVRYDNPVKKV